MLWGSNLLKQKGLSSLTRIPLDFAKINLIITLQNFLCGDGRTRTAVQTPHQAAFYTLSLALVFDQGLPSDGPPKAYPLDLSGA